MSAISSVGSSVPVVNQNIQAVAAKKVEPASNSASQSAQAASQATDNDGDHDGGRIDVHA